MKTSIITGAGGFIGYHLTHYLKQKGHTVIGIDVKYPEFAPTKADEFILQDLRDPKKTIKTIHTADELYMLAADMGGMGYIDHVGASLMRDNTLINLNSLEAARINSIQKIFFASSACIYPQDIQTKINHTGLKESDALPAYPDTPYGWEKLYSERLCLSYIRDYKMNISIARFHNIYGPLGTYDGGREKSPAALCRKIALAKKQDTIDIWGDGKQTRSYCYVSDCCEGIYRLMNSDYHEPINIGTDRSVSINQMVKIIAAIADKKIDCRYDLTKPQGVRGRNSDNSLSKKILHWNPQVSLELGLKLTYEWILSQLTK